MTGVQMLIAIVDLPKKCGCGSDEGTIIRSGIERSRRELLAEVECSGCRHRLLVPDKNGEELRKVLRETYRATWYCQPDTGNIVHWTAVESA